MSEEVFAALLEESVLREWEEYANAPEPVVSPKHKRTMKRIFGMYEKNTVSLRETNSPRIKTRIKLTRKAAVLIFAIIFLAAIAGCAVAYFIANGFRGNVYDKYTKIFSLNAEECPQIIEEPYYLTEIPYGFEIVESITAPTMYYTQYINNDTDQTLVLRQYTKKSFSPQFDNERTKFEEIEIGNSLGLFLNWSDKAKDYCELFWDDGNYILEISGNFTKKDLINLAKTLNFKI